MPVARNKHRSNPLVAAILRPVRQTAQFVRDLPARRVLGVVSASRPGLNRSGQAGAALARLLSRAHVVLPSGRTTGMRKSRIVRDGFRWATDAAPLRRQSVPAHTQISTREDGFPGMATAKPVAGSLSSGLNPWADKERTIPLHRAEVRSGDGPRIPRLEKTTAFSTPPDLDFPLSRPPVPVASWLGMSPPEPEPAERVQSLPVPSPAAPVSRAWPVTPQMFQDVPGMPAPISSVRHGALPVASAKPLSPSVRDAFGVPSPPRLRPSLDLLPIALLPQVGEGSTRKDLQDTESLLAAQTPVPRFHVSLTEKAGVALEKREEPISPEPQRRFLESLTPFHTPKLAQSATGLPRSLETQDGLPEPALRRETALASWAGLSASALPMRTPRRESPAQRSDHGQESKSRPMPTARATAAPDLSFPEYTRLRAEDTSRTPRALMAAPRADLRPAATVMRAAPPEAARHAATPLLPLFQSGAATKETHGGGTLIQRSAVGESPAGDAPQPPAAGDTAAKHGSHDTQGGDTGGSDVALLAGEVWALLKRRLAVEAERQGRHG